jgi:hypothetical protein
MGQIIRFLGLIIAAILMLGGLMLLAMGGGVFSPNDLPIPAVASLLQQVLSAGKTAAWIGGGVGIALGVVVMAGAGAAASGGGGSDRDVTISRNRLGDTTVSLAGLRRLAEHVVSGTNGVDDVIARARAARNGVISFRCQIVVKPDCSIPELERELRARLCSAVLHHIGQSETQTRIDIQARVGRFEVARKRVR